MKFGLSFSSKYLETWEVKWNWKTTGSFASKALALWLYLPQLCGSWFSLIRDRWASDSNTQFLLNNVEQNPQWITLFSLGTQNLNDSLEHHGGHSLSVKREVLVTSNRAISRAIFQHRQLNLWGKSVMFFMRRGIGFSAALWNHLVFTHPTAMASNFRSETIYAVTRLAWWLGGWLWGARWICRYPALCKLLLSKWLFCLGW